MTHASFEREVPVLDKDIRKILSKLAKDRISESEAEDYLLQLKKEQQEESVEEDYDEYRALYTPPIGVGNPSKLLIHFPQILFLWWKALALELKSFFLPLIEIHQLDKKRTWDLKDLALFSGSALKVLECHKPEHKNSEDDINFIHAHMIKKDDLKKSPLFKKNNRHHNIDAFWLINEDIEENAAHDIWIILLKSLGTFDSTYKFNSIYKHQYDTIYSAYLLIRELLFRG